MAKFQYKLQSVLDIKEKLESQERIAFGLAMAKLSEEQEVLQRLMIQKAGYDKQSKKLLEGNINLRERKTYEKLREKKFEEFKAEVFYEENKEVDELVSYTYHQNED